MRPALAALLGVCLLATAAPGRPVPEAVVRKEIGNRYLKQRDYRGARNAYLSALQLDPGYADAHYNLGVVYFFRLQDYPRAIYHFTRYARLNPQAPDLDQVRGLTPQALEKIEEAEREAYRKALAEGTPEALEAFVDAHPLSPYVSDAEDKTKRLREYEAERRRHHEAVQRAFETALAQATPEALGRFLASHPDAPQAAEARRLKQQWETRRAQDRAAFEAARADGSIGSLQAFISAHPDSEFAADARAELERLRGGEEAFRIAAEARSPKALERFLTVYPDSPRAPEARALLEELASGPTEAQTAPSEANGEGEPPASRGAREPALEAAGSESEPASGARDAGRPRSKRDALERYRSMLQGD